MLIMDVSRTRIWLFPKMLRDHALVTIPGAWEGAALATRPSLRASPPGCRDDLMAPMPVYPRGTAAVGRAEGSALCSPQQWLGNHTRSGAPGGYRYTGKRQRYGRTLGQPGVALALRHQHASSQRYIDCIAKPRATASQPRCHVASAEPPPTGSEIGALTHLSNIVNRPTMGSLSVCVQSVSLIHSRKGARMCGTWPIVSRSND